MSGDDFDRELRSMGPVRWRDVRPIARWIGGIVSALVVVLVGALAANWLAERDLHVEQTQQLIAIREKDQGQDAQHRDAAAQRVETARLLSALAATVEQLERRMDRIDKRMEQAPKWVFPESKDKK